MSKRFLGAVLTVAMILTAGCLKPKLSGGGSDGQSLAVEGGTLRLSMFTAPKGIFHPILAEDQYDSQVNSLLFSGLLTTNERLEFICDLCESYAVSEEGKVVTFTLRQGVKWHDGQPFTARDVTFTFRTMLHPDYTGMRTGNYAALVGVQQMLDRRDEYALQVEAGKLTAAEAKSKRDEDWQAWLDGAGSRAMRLVDDYTVALATEIPYAPLLPSLAQAIMPKHIFGEVPVGEMEHHPAVHSPVGTGPYQFVSYKTDQYVELARYEGYHLGKPHIPTVIYKVVNQNAAIGQLKAGELDMAPVLPGDVPLIAQEQGIQLVERPAFGYQYLGVKHDHPILSDQRVRQALMYGIDRKGMVEHLLKGHGTVINSHMLPMLWAYDPAALNSYPHDPVKALELLAQVGWTEKNEDGYLVKDGKVLGFTLRYPAGNKMREASAPLIQANLKAIGVKVNLVKLEFNTLAQEVFTERTADAWLLGWGLGADPDPGPVFLANNKWGRATGWISKRSDELIEEGVQRLKPAERKPIYVEWARLLNEELPYIFLYAQNDIDAIRVDRVKGLKPDARGPLWNIWELWIPKELQG